MYVTLFLFDVQIRFKAARVTPENPIICRLCVITVRDRKKIFKRKLLLPIRVIIWQNNLRKFIKQNRKVAGFSLKYLSSTINFIPLMNANLFEVSGYNVHVT